MKLDVYAFGSALVDVQLSVTDKVLEDIGAVKGNMALTGRSEQEAVLRRLMGADLSCLDSLAGKANMAAGGSAANTVFGVAQLGGSAGLCGKVAGDAFGDFYINNMKQSGVVFTGRKVAGMTGTCIILISDDAQRTMLTCLGVSSEIDYDDIDEAQLKNSQYLYLEGYLFDSALATQTMLHAIATAKKHGVKIAFTASDAFCISRHKDTFLKLLPQVDLLFCNAQEAQALSDTGTNDEALKALAALCPAIALTDGGSGSLLCFNGETLPVKPCTVSPVDTTGAGDSYAAGLLYGLTSGRSLAASGAIASLFSSRVVAQLGPRFAGDIRSEIAALNKQ
jgi:sugar/nucleoside kinase (ribokinase family)